MQILKNHLGGVGGVVPRIECRMQSHNLTILQTYETISWKGVGGKVTFLSNFGNGVCEIKGKRNYA